MPQPLVLLPGLLLDDALWAHQTAHLADAADITVADLSRADDMAGMARDVLAAAPRRFALAGLSMGGYAALEVMRQAPERVTKLALIDTSARPDTPEQTRRRRGFVDLARQGRFRGVTPRLLPLYVHPDRLEDAALCESITQQAERLGPDVFVAQQTAVMGRPDSRHDLSAIDCPTLVVCGRQDLERDRFRRKRSRRLRRRRRIGLAGSGR